MPQKQNKSWKLRIILVMALIGGGYYLVKTKTTWLGDPVVKKRHESYYITKLAKELNGEEEVTVVGGRVDIVTDEHAIEVEWASKWKEAIGQSLWYGLKTDKAPKIVLLIKDESKEWKYFMMLNSALKEAEINIETDYILIK